LCLYLYLYLCLCLYLYLYFYFYLYLYLLSLMSTIILVLVFVFAFVFVFLEKNLTINLPTNQYLHLFFVDNFFHFQVVFILQRSFNFSAHDISTEIWENLKTAEVRREIMEFLQKEVRVRKRETTAFLPMQKYVNCKRQGWNFYWKWLIS